MRKKTVQSIIDGAKTEHYYSASVFFCIAQGLQSESLRAEKIPVFQLNLDSRGPILQ